MEISPSGAAILPPLAALPHVCFGLVELAQGSTIAAADDEWKDAGRVLRKERAKLSRMDLGPLGRFGQGSAHYILSLKSVGQGSSGGIGAIGVSRFEFRSFIFFRRSLF